MAHFSVIIAIVINYICRDLLSIYFMTKGNLMMIIFVFCREILFSFRIIKKKMWHLCSVRNNFNCSLIPIVKGTTQQVTLILIFFLYTVWSLPLADPNTHTPLNTLLETSIFRSCMLLPHIRLILRLAHIQSILN